MSETQYKELITKTFIDNAIRSVVMIDDEYLRYDELLNRLEIGTLDGVDPRISVTKKAVNLHNFFRNEKKILCDIDNGVDAIDAEKIRKSDLVILDYELDQGDPRKSIRLIGQLQKNDQMNLVVVYTRTQPNVVWLDLASSLRNFKSLATIAATLAIDENKLFEDWSVATESDSSFPDDWTDWITDEDLLYYVLTSDLSSLTKDKFDKSQDVNSKPFRQYASEKILKKRIKQSNDEEAHGFELRGDSCGNKWIQSGNVFVVIHSKATVDSIEEPKELWNALTAALQDWNPSYYQLLISEIQNSLKNDGLAFDSLFSSNVEGHAAWLSKILEAPDEIERDGLSNQLIHQLVDDLKGKLSSKKELQEFQHESIDALRTMKVSEKNQSIEEFSALHVKLDITDIDFNQHMLHALNANLCSKVFAGRYVTNGTLLKEIMAEEKITNWYLCVSPACDTVPLQVKGNLAKRLNPDRFLKLLVLTKTDLKTALKNATSGKNIFVFSDEKERLAFIVQNTHGAPEIEYALIHNHNNPDVDIGINGVNASFLQRNSEKNASHLKEVRLIPVSQLRDSYTARYQTVASHHLGRVGVDYFDLKKKAALISSTNPA